MKTPSSRFQHIIENIGICTTALCILWCAHCIGDYSLQTKSVAIYKHKSLLICIIHASIWTGIVFAGFMAVVKLNLLWNFKRHHSHIIPWQTLLSILLILLISHVIIDYVKWDAFLFSVSDRDLLSFNPLTQMILIIDQGLHIASLIFCYVFLNVKL